MFAEEAGARIQITIEKIESIAKSTMERLKETATTETNGFRGHQVPTGAFSKVPAAEALARQAKAAHDVFDETIRGVIADLEEFQANLLATAKAHARTDEDARAALLALGRRYHDHTYHANANFDASRSREGTNLRGTGPAADSPPAGEQTVATGPDGQQSPAGAPAGQPTDAPAAAATAGPDTAEGSGY